MNSKDGFEWTEREGLRQGVPSIGLILPASNLSSSADVFDVIVIGAGYAALTAARDATTSGNANITFINQVDKCTYLLVLIRFTSSLTGSQR